MKPEYHGIPHKLDYVNLAPISRTIVHQVWRLT